MGRKAKSKEVCNKTVDSAVKSFVSRLTAVKIYDMMEESMKQEQHEKIFFNRTEVKDAAKCYCDNCGENMIFAMQDNYHQFTVGIEDILVCLLISEANGAVPKLPKDWWTAIRNRYHGVNKQIMEKKNAKRKTPTG